MRTNLTDASASKENDLAASAVGSYEDARKHYEGLHDFLATFFNYKLFNLAVGGAEASKKFGEDAEHKEICARLDKILRSVDGQTVIGDKSLEKKIDRYVLHQFESEKDFSDYSILLSCLDAFFPVVV